MIYHVLTCNGYTIEATWPTLHEAITDCDKRERTTGDGYARIVSQDGQIIADADGAYDDPERYTDAATLTGMYDYD